jgi:hypothetical protein
MTEEATNNGVSESEDHGFGADRLAKINAIQSDRSQDRTPAGTDDDDALALLQSQAEALEEELKSYDDDEPDKKPGEDPGEEPADGEPDNKADDGKPAPESELPLYMADGQWMARIKVDGEIKEIPYARLQAAAQKLEAGDKRLEEANRLRQEIDTREQQLLQREQQLQNQPPAQGADGPSQTENGQPDDVRAIARKYHEALLNGDDDDVTADLLTQLTTAGRQQPQVDVAQIAQQVERQVEARIAAGKRESDDRQQQDVRNTELRDAFSTFKDEFKDVSGDKELLQMADRLTVIVAQEYPTYTPIQVMREAGKRTRTWLQEKTGGAVRTNRKRNLKTATGTGAVQPGKPEVKPSTRTDQLNEIRSARGQVPIG